jgi:hypothetical protein
VILVATFIITTGTVEKSSLNETRVEVPGNGENELKLKGDAW